MISRWRSEIMRWEKTLYRLLILISVLLLIVGLPNEHIPCLTPSQGTQFESTMELNRVPTNKYLWMTTMQNVCLACDLLPVTFERRPSNMTYMVRSKFNSLVWTANYFTNYTITIDGEAIAQGVIRYEQNSVLMGRVNITKSRDRHRTHWVTLNVDGLELGKHEVVLRIGADPKYACPLECCSCGAGGSAEDTVLVTVEPCLAVDFFESVKIVRQPPNMNYTEGSTGNSVEWSVNGFTNYTVYFDREVVAQGWQSTGRINIIKAYRGYNVTVNIDGLDPGVHVIMLKISASPKYLCPPGYCSCGAGNSSDIDTVWVTVEPKPHFFIPGFSVMEGMLAMAGLVGVMWRKKLSRRKRK